jgi:Tol biopolymer transport system component
MRALRPALLILEDAEAGVILSPMWSPDGQYAMFGLNPPGTFSKNDPSNSLAVIRADGSGLTRVITTPDDKVGPDWTK